MQYNWSKEDIFSDIKQLQEMIKKEENLEAKIELSKAYDVINNYAYVTYLNKTMTMSGKQYNISRLHNLCSNVTGYGTYYSILEKYYNSLKFMISENKRINKFALDNEIEIATGAHLTNDEVMSLVEDFYMSIEDDEIRKIFYTIYNNRFKTYRFENSNNKSEDYYSGKDSGSTMEGFNIFVSKLNKNYISVLDINGGKKFINTVHETGHAIGNLLNPNFSLSTEMSFFYEVASLFFELLAYNKYRNDKLDTNELIQSLYDTSIYYFFLSNDLILQQYIYQVALENNYELNRRFYKQLTENYSIDKKYVNYLLDLDFCDEAIYPLSFALALKYVNIYLDNPKEGILLFKRFIKDPILKNDSKSIIEVMNSFEDLRGFEASIIESYDLTLQKMAGGKKNVEQRLLTKEKKSI